MLALSVTDRMIFFETGPMIPLFSIPMSLQSFCLLFPFSAALMHFLILQRNTEQNLFMKFLSTGGQDIKKIDRVSLKIIRALNQILFYILPYSALVIFQIRFSSWQNGILSAYHTLLVCFDFFLILYFAPETSKLHSKKGGSLKYIFTVHFRKGLFSLIASVFLFFSFSRKEIQMIRREKGSLPGIKLSRVLKSLPSSWAVILSAASMLNASLLFSVLNSEENLSDYTVNSFIISVESVFQENNSEYSVLFPRLNLPNENLSSGGRFHFSNRNFRFADFRGSVLNLNSFHLAHTENADFTECRWVSKTAE